MTPGSSGRSVTGTRRARFTLPFCTRGVRPGQDVAARQLADFQAGEVHRRPVACPRALDRHSGHVKTSHPREAARRQHLLLVPERQPARDQGAGRHGAEAAQREDAVHRQARQSHGGTLGRLAGQGDERLLQLGQALAAARRDPVDRRAVEERAGRQFARLQLGERLAVCVGDVALGQRDDVEDLMQIFDVLVMSSRYGEAFPNVVVEAMACSIPCVVTDVGDAAEIVGDTGWVIPPGDSAMLANALRDALGEPSEQRAARGTRARRRVEENYGIERMVLAYRKVWYEASGKC